ncbi:AraC family transcriptional regulator [Pseudoxanthomonas suwonensis]|uniref:AraC family transcriptional regulator n=1 Tax=Pseudoxanthomonas suwonensis TaxID=314722 RepID=UPI0009E5AF72|nr:AraC family transcriptional regulator [Pseudoxanthomonas suwonensis]
MDALSEILRVVHLSGAFFVHARFTAPWCYQSPCAAISAPWLEPGAERVVIFHLVTEGECLVEMDCMPPLRARAGDVVIFPHGQEHRMASEPGLPPARSANLKKLLSRRPARLMHGGGGRATRIVCGYMACDLRLAQLLLNGLPPVISVNVRDWKAGEWLESSVRHALAEARSPVPGGASLLSRLAEVLFIEVLRQHTHQNESRQGWLAGLADRVVGRALNALHERPANDWTLEELARVAGTSRSVLAERFQHLVGTSPMQYLTQWRLAMAANLLSRSSAPLANIAEEVGYQTDTSFIRAFRREYGMPPAAWRRNLIGDGGYAGPPRETRTGQASGRSVKYR